MITSYAGGKMTTHLDAAHEILTSAIVLDGLGGAVVRPAPHVEDGTYEEKMVADGWTAMNSTIVSEPYYTPTWPEALQAMYENLLYFEMNPMAIHAETPDDIVLAKQQGKFAVILGLQSPSCIEQDRSRIRLLHKLGLRVFQLTYMERNFLGDGCLEPENRGLTHFGIQVVRECNRLGMIIDCSHVGIQTTLDAAHHSADPIVVSHTAARAITDNPRCVTDEQMLAVANGGGLIGITAFAPLICSTRPPTLDDFLNHIEHALNLVGPDHVGISTDMFDGKTKTNWATPWYYPEVTQGAKHGSLGVAGFANKSELINVVAGLLQRGVDSTTIKKILGENWMRIIRTVWTKGEHLES
jgi:membrane dipeptidase